MKALEDYLPYSSFITDEILKIKGGSYLMCFELDGIPYQGVKPEIVSSRIEKINHLVKRLRAPTRYNMYIQFHCLRDFEYTFLEGKFDQKFAQDLNDNYFNNRFSLPNLKNRYFISVVYRPYRRAGGKSILEFSATTAKKYAEQAIEELGKVKQQILSDFADYHVRVLGHYEKNGVKFSGLLRFLNNLVNFDNSHVPLQNATVDQYLPQSTLHIGNAGMIKISTKGVDRYATMISVFEYPDLTYDTCLQEALYCDCQAIISQVFVPVDKVEAQSFLRKEFMRKAKSDSVSPEELASIQGAISGVTSDSFVLGQFYWQLTLYSANPEYLREATMRTISALGDLGFIASVNEVAPLSSYLSNLPANIRYLPRTPKISSANFAQMMSFLQPLKGKKEGNAWGSAITALPTRELGSYYFNFHNTLADQDSTGEKVVGNTIITGTTGAGKTVFLSFLLAQTQRLANPPRVFIFDKDLGSAVFVKAMGGKYSQIRMGESTGFNPFQLDNTDQNKAFLTELVKAILGEDVKLRPKEVNEIEAAITQTMAQPKELRDIEAFSNFLPEGEDSIRQRLRAWTKGQYSWVFNNPNDNFETDARIIGIDYTQFLDIPALSTPILMYIFYRINNIQQTKEPYIISLDEAWKPLSSPRFQDFIVDELRTIRKKNGILLLTSQAPNDFYENVSPVIMQQIATQIFLPNPEGSKELYCGQLNFSEAEFGLFKSLAPTDRACLIKTQKSSVFCSINMGKMREIDVLSGNEERSILADEAIAEDPENWLELYYQKVEEEREKYRKVAESI